jgi:hypothetical protein
MAIVLVSTGSLSLGALASASAAEVTANAMVTVLDFGSAGWSYKQTAYDGAPGFQAPSFNDASWSVGKAGFGTVDGRCSWNNPSRVATSWTPATDLLLRHRFTLPAGVTGIHIAGDVDNNADVYINGGLVQHAESGFCAAGAINVDVPQIILSNDNVIAIRARDLGDATFVDVRLTYTMSPACPQSASALLRPVKLPGASVPPRINRLNATFHYGALPLDFTSVANAGESLCTLVSQRGALPIIADFRILGQTVAPSRLVQALLLQSLPSGDPVKAFLSAIFL